MAKLSRFTQLIFGSTAGSAQIAEYGSLAAGSPLTFSGATITPALVQAFSNYLEGWDGAVIGGNSPAIEDMNALCYLYAFQLAYLFQAGIPEWDSATTYYTGSYVQSSGIIYRSIVDSNLNNAVSVLTAWGPPISAGHLLQNAIAGNLTIVSGQCLFNPYASIAVGQTITVNSGAQLVSVGTMKVLGTLVVNGICKILP